AAPGLPRPRHGVAEVEARDGVGEVAHEVPPPELAIGEDLEPEVTLLLERLHDVPVLEGAEPLGVRPLGLARLEDLGGTQEAPDLVCAVWRGHGPRLSISTAVDLDGGRSPARRAAKRAGPALASDRRRVALGLGHLEQDLRAQVRGGHPPE